MKANAGLFARLESSNISSRYLEFTGVNDLLISHEHKGVYQVNIDADFTKVASYQKTEVNKSIKSSLSKYDNRVIYGADEGIFYFDINTQKSLEQEYKK